MYYAFDNVIYSCAGRRIEEKKYASKANSGVAHYSPVIVAFAMYHGKERRTNINILYYVAHRISKQKIRSDSENFSTASRGHEHSRMFLISEFPLLQ